MYPHNSRKDRVRHREWVAQGPVMGYHCPWVMEKKAWIESCSLHRHHVMMLCLCFCKYFTFQSRAGFPQDGSVSDPYHVLGDLLVTSGSFLKLSLIYGSPRSFLATQAFKGGLTNLNYCWSKTDPKGQWFSLGISQLCSKSC